MDRQIQYPAQIPLVEDMLNAQRNAMVGVGHLAGAAFGANTVAASGFACAPGEGLALTLAPGALLAPGVVDASAYGTLAAVSSALVRQFISRDPVTLAVPAAGATYIVSAAPQTVDTDDTVLPFYNAADPSVTYAGEGNSGLAAPTARRDEAALSIGASVPKGSYPLWQIIVPAGATAITAGMISVASGAPFYPSLASVAPRIVAPFNAQLAAAMGGYPLNAVVADPTTPGTFWVSTADANVSTPGASGAMWQSLFNGYATEDWANKSFVKNNAGTQGGIVALDLDGDGSGRVTFEAASGHWGALQPAGDYATNTALTNASANLQTNITHEAATRANADAGLQSQINNKISTTLVDDGINSAVTIMSRLDADNTIWVGTAKSGSMTLVKSKPASGFYKILNLTTDANGNIIVPDSSGRTWAYAHGNSGKIAARGNLLGGYYVRNGNVLRQVFTYTANYGDFIHFPTSYAETPVVHVTAAAYGGMATTANILGRPAYNGFTFISSVYAGRPNRLENTGTNTISVMVDGWVNS